VDNRYLPPIYQGFDKSADGWAHQPVGLCKLNSVYP
jgi:hypothetical protein